MRTIWKPYGIRKEVVELAVAEGDAELIERFLNATKALTQAKAAKAIGVDQSRISDWRRGERPALQERTSNAIRNYLATRQVKRGRVRVAEGKAEYDANNAAESLLTSERALFRTLTDFGGPGERADDKLFMVRLLQAVAQDLKREGKQVPFKHLVDAEAAILEGRL